MLPIAYVSDWCSLVHFLIMGIVRGQLVYCVVPNGVQPQDGHIFGTMRDAKQWLKDNGFTVKN